MARRTAAVAGKRTKASNPAPTETVDEASEPSNRHRSGLVRRAMLSAAAELFAERGFGGTNLRDVADALGMSRPGLYYHFPSKEKILEALIEEVTFSFAAQLDKIDAPEDQDPEEALRSVVRISTMWVLDNPVMFRVLDRSETEMPDELREKHDVSKKAILEHITRIIERGVAVGKFRPVDAHVAALTIAGMRNWTAWWFKPEGRMHRHEIADMISEMALHSVLRPDAHRSRSDRMSDVLRILKEDVAHLEHLLKS
ncbi:TetR/AcrR family transcriptional regulator [Sphingobium chlorophenolicum]|uniref:Putative TetR family transcriptional regulator n=1 Tax=Sphingobium chlorophenolicum TaxID=46429 RepID=A0A081R9D6_SPHCR|nr:TetR/AcrR family transcriptional regulator [Sphingobium chlorophenolicum]KEQ51809.1 putative TetR family transcriptional regulator [Sphingobium chlorophenolicum]